jgi:OOP family OmpA-OmpF porin
MSKMKKAVIALLAASCAIPAMAGDVYLSASIGASAQKVDVFGDSLSGSATSVTLAAGYQFNSSFGAEVGSAHFGSASMHGAAASGNTDKPAALYAALTGAWPATESLLVYAKGGLVRTEPDSAVNGSAGGTHTHTSALLGLGVGYALTPKMTAFAEYLDFGKVADERDYTIKATTLSVGVRYTF